MDELISTYWRELGALVAFVAYTIRQEMITKSNASRLKNLEKTLSTDKTNEWVAFRATTELRLNTHEKQITELFKFHNAEDK